MSTFLRDTLERLNGALGFAVEDLRCALAKSMLVSCDNAHAVHPNHPERYDEYNRVQLNRGLVVKEAANQKYCTDAFSRAVFCALCADAGVPLQAYANRSDMPGGEKVNGVTRDGLFAVVAQHVGSMVVGVRSLITCGQESSA